MWCLIMIACPYCKSKLVEISREENLDAIYQPSIEIVFHCKVCNKEPGMILEFEDWYDEHGIPIEIKT